MLLTKSLLYTAKNNPGKLAVVDRHHRYTYKALEGRTAKVKESLKRLGVKKGDRVGLLLLNDFRYIELIYGITALGAIAVPLNTRFSVEENAFVLNDAGIEVLYVNKEFLSLVDELKKRASGVQHVILSEDRDAPELAEHANLLSYEAVLDKESVEELVYDGVQENDVAGLFYTGGTTGRSKGVMLTHKNLLTNAVHMALNLEYRESDVYLHTAPMFHLADQASTFAVTLMGGTHTVVRQFTPKDVLRVIEKEQATAVMLVPTMVNMLLHSADFDNYDTTSLRCILYGAAPMSTELLKKTMTMLPNTQLFQAYGMTETSPVLTLLKGQNHVLNGTKEEEKRLVSCGKPVQLIEMKVVDEEGNEVPVGHVGEFIARGPNVMKGYWNLPKETSKVLRDGWYYTGDMGYKEADGFYYVVDRAKDMIISGGENVYSVEVENALSTHPAVLECAVFGAPHEQWGEVVLAAVVLKQNTDATAEEILAFIRPKISNYKVPKSIEFLAELPKSGAGKILKRVIREQYVEAAETTKA
ncbi:long-chain-fatty-acid--CoA ligase [Sporosarcina sp. FSL K6-1522]|uniref:long-chain-fatty-acid--CoA ligase n=1 Tax=Sporosarcina sp. FSL K6-1522 TaxID=2921554 RepID=UPI00315ABA40